MDAKNEMDHEVLLVFPGRHGAPDPQVPLALLHLAWPLRNAGYKVRIFDMRLEDSSKFRVGNPIFVGISAMSGLQIRYGLEFARRVRGQNPSCPIVWGGVHPSMLPGQTVENEFVDAVVRGEGESIVVELAKNLEEGRPINGLAGLTYKSEGRIMSNPDGQLIDLDSIPLELPYDLLTMDKYPSFKAGRFHMQTSRGCPHRCGFCYNIQFNKRRWRGKSAARVLDEIAYVLEKFPWVTVIDPIDDNFFVDRKRVEDICKGLIDHRIKVTWRANCRFDYLSSYDEEFIKLLQNSGCRELDFGGESGSDRIQSSINKDVTPDQMIRGIEKLKLWGPNIEPYVSWMSGLPNENDDDLNKTFNLMDKLSEVNPKTQHFGIFIFTPFPSPIQASLGGEYKVPLSLEEWGNIDAFHFNPPWHSKRYVERLHTVSAVTKYKFYPKGRLDERSYAYRFAYGTMNRIAKFRWKHRYFGFPIELKLIDASIRKIRGYL